VYFKIKNTKYSLTLFYCVVSVISGGDTQVGYQFYVTGVNNTVSIYLKYGYVA
jgi:hypothetical protein